MSESGFSIYNALIKPLRDADASLLLQRFLMGPQAIHDQAEVTILSLLDQIKPDLVRSDLLQYLLPIVGFTTELRSITDRLSEAQQRKLIALAVPMWNERHTSQGLINAVRLLTGRAAFVSTWFAYRAVLGEVALTEDQLTTGGDLWIIGGATSNYDENWSNIRLMDDGTLDELLLLDICKLMRPMGERFEIFLDDFLDLFDAELDKWETLAGSAPTIVTGTMLVPSGAAVKPVIPIITDQALNKDYNIVSKFKLGAGATFVTRWYCESNATTLGTSFELRIKATAPRVTYIQYRDGVAVNTQTTNAFSVVEEVWYKLRVNTVNPTATTREHRLVIDNNLLFDNGSGKYTDTVNVDERPEAGFYMFGASGGNIHLDNVESWRDPGRFATIDIGTPAEPRGAVVMTDNFVE